MFPHVQKRNGNPLVVWDFIYSRSSFVSFAGLNSTWSEIRSFPMSRRGDEIPIAAQIVSVVDAYHALISERVYKRAYSKEDAY